VRSALERNSEQKLRWETLRAGEGPGRGRAMAGYAERSRVAGGRAARRDEHSWFPLAFLLSVVAMYVVIGWVIFSIAGWFL
jgi:hypothetical protein